MSIHSMSWPAKTKHLPVFWLSSFEQVCCEILLHCTLTLLADCHMSTIKYNWQRTQAEAKAEAKAEASRKVSGCHTR